VSSAAGDEVLDTMAQLRQLAVAATQVAHAGSAGQRAEARKVLAEARRALYRILAEDVPGKE
jgi:replicative DNA helicase